MNYQEEAKSAKQFYEDCLNTLTKKANDYANDADCFSNFKFIAQTAKIPVETVFMVFLSVKLARLSELVGSNKEAKNEPIKDTLSDLSNYACLMAMYMYGDKQ